MPNGGSDCCGTCWFNRKNKGKAGHPKTETHEPAYCEIRDIGITNPFWTYCANHPKRSPDRDPVPIGPVFVDEGKGREIWKHCPDTETVRRHLLDLLAQIQERPAAEYPIGIYRDELVIWQLGELRDQRALNSLERIASFDPSVSYEPFRRSRKSCVEAAKVAMARIRDRDGGA